MDDNDLREIVETYRGRRFIAGLFIKAGLFRQSETGQGDTVTAFREGQRSIALHISGLLFTIDPKKFTLIIDEWKEREKNERSGSDD